MEQEKKRISDLMTKTDSSDYKKIMELSEQLATVEQNIDTATERWLELEERK